MSRLLGSLWASPLTLACLLVAEACGARRVGRVDRLTRYVAPERGPLASFFRRFRMVAFCWGEVAVFAAPVYLASAQTRTHEGTHARQARRLGVLLPVLYVLAGLLALAAGGRFYRDNAFEVAARRAAGEAP